jgi:hypothetical protein
MECRGVQELLNSKKTDLWGLFERIDVREDPNHKWRNHGLSTSCTHWRVMKISVNMIEKILGDMSGK